LRVAEAQADTAGVHAARLNNDHIAADGGDLLLNALGGPAAHGDHGDHRADADDDAQHGQRAAQFVDAQRAKRDLHGLENLFHAAGSFTA